MKKLLVYLAAVLLLAAMGTGSAYGASEELLPMLARPRELTGEHYRSVAVAAVDDMITLKLGEAPPDWEVAITGDAVLGPVMTFAPVKGAQGIWIAKAPGTATITAVGYYPCQRQQPACKIASPVHEVKVIVQPRRTLAGSFRIGQNAFLENSRTYVAAADLAQALGALYSEPDGECVLEAGGAAVALRAGSKAMSVGDAAVAMDVAPVVRDGRLYLPMRWVSEALGYRVGWDGGAWTASFSGE